MNKKIIIFVLLMLLVLINVLIIIDSFIENDSTIYPVYNDGTILLFDPVNNTKCEAATSSATGTNDTCMKWYAFLDSENSSTVNLILDHNTTGYVAWNNSLNGVTPETANLQLQKDITNWSEQVKITARLISANEIHQIAPRKIVIDETGKQKGKWSQTDTAKWYFFHTGTHTAYKGDIGTNKYAWLFDNTNGCEEYGCNMSDDGTYGYWASSYASGSSAWSVYFGGDMVISQIINDKNRGIRPVITVDKSVFE